MLAVYDEDADDWPMFGLLVGPSEVDDKISRHAATRRPMTSGIRDPSR